MDNLPQNNRATGKEVLNLINTLVKLSKKLLKTKVGSHISRAHVLALELLRLSKAKDRKYRTPRSPAFSKIKEIITDIMSHPQFHESKRLYLDMHGLILEASIWLLAGSTR